MYEASTGLLEVVVAAYGRSPLLDQTLRSLLNHLPADLPITVLDDASPTDDVQRIAAPFMPRVRYRRNEANLGVSGAFNAAMRLSRSRFTVLVGPDDRALPGFAGVYLDAIARYPDVAAIHPGVLVIDADGNRVTPLGDRVKALLRPRGEGELTGEALVTRLLAGNWTYNPAIAWRTDIVRGSPFDEQLHTAMDLDLLLRLAFAGEHVALVDGPALEYRRHAGAVSSVNAGAKRLREELQIHRRAAQQARARGWRRAAATATLAPTARINALLVAATASGPGRAETVRMAVGRLP